MYKLLIGTDIVLAALFALQFRFLPQQIPLFYSRPWGEAQIVDHWYILLLPILMHIFYFTNIFLSNRLFEHENIPQRILLAVNNTMVIVFAIIFIRILFLVT